MHEPVVPVEPEIKDDGIAARLEKQPGEVDSRGRFLGAIRQEYGENGPEGRCGDQRLDDSKDAHIRNAITLVDITVQKAYLVA